MRLSILYISAGILLLASCSCGGGKKQDAEEATDSVHVAHDIVIEDSTMIYDNNTSAWLGQALNKPAINWSRFKLVEFWGEDSTTERQPLKTNPDFYKNYAPVLKWSVDSMHVLDIGSYGSVMMKNKAGKDTLVHGEPDTEVSLLYPKENLRKRILFGGPSVRVLNAVWADSSEVAMLTSVEKIDSAQKGHTDTLLWLIDVKNNFYRKYKWQ